MENNEEHKIEFQDKLSAFYRVNKFKLIVAACILVTILGSIVIFKILDEKNNNLISEKYIQAGLYLSLDQKEESINLYQEIILSEHNFYSILALNKILEKDLEPNKNKVLNHFEIIEKLNLDNEQKDLIIFKKALYLIKASDKQEGNKLLNELIDRNSKFKILSEEILSK